MSLEGFDRKNMKWLEAIKFQAAGGQEQGFRHELNTFLDEIRHSSKDSGVLDMMFHENADVPGYFVVHLFWDTEQSPQQGSTAGLHLKQMLKAYGLVDHTVWFDQRQ